MFHLFAGLFISLYVNLFIFSDYRQNDSLLLPSEERCSSLRFSSKQRTKTPPILKRVFEGENGKTFFTGKIDV